MPMMQMAPPQEEGNKVLLPKGSYRTYLHEGAGVIVAVPHRMNYFLQGNEEGSKSFEVFYQRYSAGGEFPANGWSSSKISIKRSGGATSVSFKAADGTKVSTQGKMFEFDIISRMFGQGNLKIDSYSVLVN